LLDSILIPVTSASMDDVYVTTPCFRATWEERKFSLSSHVAWKQGQGRGSWTLVWGIFALLLFSN